MWHLILKFFLRTLYLAKSQRFAMMKDTVDNKHFCFPCLFFRTMFPNPSCEYQASVWCPLGNAEGKRKSRLSQLPCDKVRELEKPQLSSLKSCLLSGVFSSKRPSSLVKHYEICIRGAFRMQVFPLHSGLMWPLSSLLHFLTEMLLQPGCQPQIYVRRFKKWTGGLVCLGSYPN